VDNRSFSVKAKNERRYKMRDIKKIGEIIKKKRISKGLTLINVVDQLYKKGIEVSDSSCSRYECGKSNFIPYDVLEGLGEILNFNPAFIVGWNKPLGTITTKPGKTSSTLINVYENIKKIGDIKNMKPVSNIEIPDSWTSYGIRYLGIKITDSNLYPGFFIGDIAIVKIQNTFKDGDLCVVSINDTDITLKEIHKNEKGVLLRYPNLFSTDLVLEENEVEILGKVVEVRRTID
jgi:SOS-response transcriptional repressor LexA